jgi:hypothetical protein
VQPREQELVRASVADQARAADRASTTPVAPSRPSIRRPVEPAAAPARRAPRAPTHPMRKLAARRRSQPASASCLRDEAHHQGSKAAPTGKPAGKPALTAEAAPVPGPTVAHAAPWDPWDATAAVHPAAKSGLDARSDPPAAKAGHRSASAAHPSAARADAPAVVPGSPPYGPMAVACPDPKGAVVFRAARRNRCKRAANPLPSTGRAPG